MAAVVLSLLLASATAAGAGSLGETLLYTHDAVACRDIPLTGWKHPARDVLERGNVKLERLQFCNEDKFSIFTVRFRFDPRGQTGSYFDPLYARLAEANAFRSYAFVDRDDSVIVRVNIDFRHGLQIEYEEFSASD